MKQIFRRKHDQLIMEGEVVRTPCFVSVARDDRRYGGAEEGGWWYDTRDVVEVHYCANLYVLGRVMKRVGQYLGVSEYPISSVCSYGVYVVAVGEVLESYPDRRPHYE